MPYSRKGSNDSGQASKDTVSPSSYDATSGEKWIELEDYSTQATQDSGHSSCDGIGSKSDLKLGGPHNAFSCAITGIRRSFYVVFFSNLKKKIEKFFKKIEKKNSIFQSRDAFCNNIMLEVNFQKNLH